MSSQHILSHGSIIEIRRVSTGAFLILLAVYTTSFGVGCSRHEPPHEFAELRVYATQVDAGGKRKDATSHLCTRIDRNSAPELLRNVTYERTTPIWKGGWHGEVVMDDGRVLRVAVSRASGYFKIQDQHGVYVVDDRFRDEWDATLRRVEEEYQKILETRISQAATTQPSPE